MGGLSTYRDLLQLLHSCLPGALHEHDEDKSGARNIAVPAVHIMGYSLNALLMH